MIAFVLFLCVQWTVALQTQVEYEFSFKCGNQPVTGELIVQKGGSELLKVDVGRAHRNQFNEIRKYMEFPTGAFKLILKTGCGALSKIGELCFHEYTSQPFMTQQGASKYLVFLDHVDLFSEIANQTSKVELVCT